MHSSAFEVTAAIATPVAAVGCEYWARMVHRYLWHGPLWALHKSHHRGPGDVAPAPRGSTVWEANDVFALVHAALAMGLVMLGLNVQHAVWGGVLLGGGAGLSLYGLAYGLVHDAIIHERIWRLRWTRGYWRRVRGAHLAHHRTGTAPYGLFLGPYEPRRSRDAGPHPTHTKRRSNAASASARD